MARPKSQKQITTVLNQSGEGKIRQVIIEANLMNHMFKKQLLEQIPLRDQPREQNAIIDLVDRNLAAKQRHAAADVSALEQETDQLVYAPYGLTHEEIRIVEGAAK